MWASICVAHMVNLTSPLQVIAKEVYLLSDNVTNDRSGAHMMAQQSHVGMCTEYFPFR